jgi:nitrogen fixation/metabolism regulation signal transduction histidine kinase
MDVLIEVYNRMIETLREERLRHEEQNLLLGKLINASPSGIIILDFDGQIELMNPAAEDFLQVSGVDVIGEPMKAIAGIWGKTIDQLNLDENAVLTLSGLKIYRIQKAAFLDRGFKQHFILIESLSEEIIKSERKSYENVIRMMSHEVNNSVGAVNSILNSSLDFFNNMTGDQSDFADAIRIAIRRNQHLNKFMSNFAEVVHIPEPVRSKTDLHKVIQDVKTLVSSDYQDKKVNWSWELTDGEFVIDSDIHQMEQVLVNILKNALEAVEDNGNITIITGTEPVKKLIIRDNGRGVSPEIRDRIFSPFFSTKKTGQGIGLTLVREILLNHGFSFNLETNSEGCTDFSIMFN